MPPFLALALCALFVIVVYKIDSRLNPYRPATLWIPLIWFLIIGSRPISYWFSITPVSMEEALLEGNPIDRTIYLTLILWGAVILHRRRLNVNSIVSNNFPLAVLILYSLISIVWSDFPLISMKRWVKFAGSIVMVLVVVTEVNAIEALKTMNRRCIYVLIPLSIVMYKYFPQIGRGWDDWTGAQMVNGISYNKNGLGCLCLTSGLVLYWDLLTLKGAVAIESYHRQVLLCLMFMAMIIFLLIKSDSMTSFATLLIGIGVIHCLGLNIIRNSKMAIGIVLLLIVAVMAIGNMESDLGFFVSKLFGRDSTLTGRTYLWSALLDMETNSVLGDGFESFWLGDRLSALWSQFMWRPTQAHNGYLEIYLNLGIFGLFLLTVYVFSLYKKAAKMIHEDVDVCRLRIAFILVLLVYNITEAAFLRTTSSLWYIFLIATMYIPSQKYSTVSQVILSKHNPLGV